MRRLSKEAIERIQEAIEVEHAAGDSQLASDFQVLLDWYTAYYTKEKPHPGNCECSECWQAMEGGSKV